MWQILMCYLCCAALLTCGSARGLPKSNDRLQYLYEDTAINYNYSIQPRSSLVYQKSYRTTERPLVRYWNNFVRSIRLPVPSITWNVTNPLVNLFNPGGASVIEPPLPTYETNVKRRRKNHRRQSNIVVKRTKKRKRPQTTPRPAPSESDGYNPHDLELDANSPFYFYDANSGQYYEMQRLDSTYTNSYNAHNQYEEPEVPVDSSVDDASEDSSTEYINSNNSEEKTDFETDETTKEIDPMEASDWREAESSEKNPASVENIRESLRNVQELKSNNHRGRKRSRTNPRRKSATSDVPTLKSSNALSYFLIEAV